MDLVDLQLELTHWQNRPNLMVAEQLLARAEALDFLAFVDEAIRMQRPATPAGNTLRTAASTFAGELTACNQALFQQVRNAIRTGTLRGNQLRSCLTQFTSYGSPVCDGVYTSYDGLDVLLDGIFRLQQAPAPTLPQEVEMVHCEETPARAILDLIDHVDWQAHDLFYDLGSGLGQVVMLVNLLTGMAARGVEVEPAFVDFATAQATSLQLNAVTFLNCDARTADYRDGTIFFLFTPFRGDMLRTVLARLQEVAADHSIRICTFGSCTPRVAEQGWLRPCHGNPQHEYQLVIFCSKS